MQLASRVAELKVTDKSSAVAGLESRRRSVAGSVRVGTTQHLALFQPDAEQLICVCVCIHSVVIQITRASLWEKKSGIA